MQQILRIERYIFPKSFDILLRSQGINCKFMFLNTCDASLDNETIIKKKRLRTADRKNEAKIRKARLRMEKLNRNDSLKHEDEVRNFFARLQPNRK